MKIYFHSALYLTIILLLFACKKEPSIYLISNCDDDSPYHHQKKIKDASKNFEISIGQHWKRELYFSPSQSRIYTADTTRSFSSSFIIDVTRYKGKLAINDTLRQETTKAITALNRSYILKDGFATFKEQPSYIVYSFQKLDNTIQYKIQCFVSFKEAHYVMTSQINGNKNLENNVCESLQIFNSLTTLP